MINKLTFLSIALGIGSFFLAFSNFNEPESKAHQLKCRTDPPLNTGLKRLDSFLCIIIPFFQQALSSPEGLFVTNALMTTATVVFFIFCLEGLRAKSSGLVLFPVLFGSLGQVFGIGPVSMALFVPSYIYSDRAAKSSLLHRSMSLSGVYLSLALVLLFTATTIIMDTLPTSSNAFIRINTIWQFGPLIFIFTTFFRFLKPAPADLTVPVIRGGLLLLGGISFALYYDGFGRLLAKPGLLDSITLDTLQQPEVFLGRLNFSAPAVRFLLVDLLAVFSAPVLVLVQDGLLSFSDLFGLLFAAILLSPGAALALYFARREGKVQTEKTLPRPKYH